MSRSKPNLAIATGAAVIATGAVSGAALVTSADASPVTHTMKFVTVVDRSHQVGRNGFMETAIERNHGRFVGYDVVSGLIDRQTPSAKIYVAVARKGGLLFLRVRTTSETTFVGRVTGGSGTFKGATGTLTAHQAPHNDSKTYVTIHYTLP